MDRLGVRDIALGDEKYTVTVDVAAWPIIQALAARAIASKSKTATALKGGVRVTVVSRG